MVYDMGIGIDCSAYYWKEDAYMRLYNMPKAKEIIGEDVEDELKEDEVTKLEDIVEMVIDGFDSDNSSGFGFEGLLAETINAAENLKPGTFKYDGYCLYVPARFPQTAADKTNMLSVEEIKKIFEKHVDPLLKKPANIQWHFIED